MSSLVFISFGEVNDEGTLCHFHQEQDILLFTLGVVDSTMMSFTTGGAQCGQLIVAEKRKELIVVAVSSVRYLYWH